MFIKVTSAIDGGALLLNVAHVVSVYTYPHGAERLCIIEVTGSAAGGCAPRKLEVREHFADVSATISRLTAVGVPE